MRTNLYFRYLRRPPTERRLLREAAALLLCTRALLWLLPLRQVRRTMETLSRRLAGRRAESVELNRLLRAFAALERRCGFTCLTNAVAAQSFLTAHGHASRLRFGAAKNEGCFRAHAWLENEDRVLVGGPEELIDRYARFPDFDEALK